MWKAGTPTVDDRMLRQQAVVVSRTDHLPLIMPVMLEV
jgi:hypothetical protein